MPTTLEDLAQALSECPTPREPTPHPPFRYELLLQVPGGPGEPLERRWSPGDLIRLRVQEGIIDRPGGGQCAIWEGAAERADESAPSQPGLQTSHQGCVPAPEPGLTLGLAIALLALSVTALGRGPSRRRSA